MSNIKILYSGFIDPRHSQYGGYDKILDIDMPHDTLLLTDCPFGNISLSSKLVRLPLLLLDFKTRISSRKYDITHLFYGDVTIFPLLPYRKSEKHKYVVTLHLDVERYRFKQQLIRELRKCDAVVVLSSQQQQVLKEKYNIDSVFIPHGYNTPEFERALPTDRNGHKLATSELNVVTVGKTYRDFDTFEFAVKTAQQLNLPIQFHLVGAPSEIKNRLAVYDNLHVYDFIPDNEFYSIIEAADHCFLPLTFATANNTLLESQVLGTPLIAPQIAGVSDYAYFNNPNQFYDSREKLTEILCNLKKCPKQDCLKEYGKRFRWNNIHAEISELYRNILTMKGEKR